MTGIEIGFLAIAALVVLVYLGMHVAIALTLVSFGGVYMIRGDLGIASNTVGLAAANSISSYEFGVIPLFILMGIFVSASNVGRDIFDAANYLFRRLRGGLGVATVGANAVFAAVTGISIASASVFTKIAVPEMLRLGYQPKFAVGVVAGSSLLGMLIPPSLLFIIFGLLAEVSIGDLFIAGILPGLLLSVLFAIMIVARAYFLPHSILVDPPHSTSPREEPSPVGFVRLLPIVFLITVVLGGIYGGFFTPTEAGAVGALGGFFIALFRKRLTFSSLWDILSEAAYVTASIGIIIIAAHVFARMIAIAGIPHELSEFIISRDIGLYSLLAIYIVIIILLGTIIDPASIMLIMVPIFLPVMQAFGADLIWFAVITVLAVEIGIITPPFGLGVFTIKNSLSEVDIPLGQIFAGAFPFVIVVFTALLLVIAFPSISLALIGS